MKLTSWPIYFKRSFARLISTQFTLHSWWQKGLTEEAYRKVEGYRGAASNSTDNRLEGLTLGELFEQVLAQKNWEEIFRSLFPDKRFVSERASFIINIRNRIMHKGDVLEIDLEKYILSIKELLDIIHTTNKRQIHAH